MFIEEMKKAETADVVQFVDEMVAPLSLEILLSKRNDTLAVCGTLQNNLELPKYRFCKSLKGAYIVFFEDYLKLKQ